MVINMKCEACNKQIYGSARPYCNEKCEKIHKDLQSALKDLGI